MKYLSVFIVFSQLLFAADRPVPPPWGENLALTGGKKAVEFFSPRLKDTECRKELADAEKFEAASRSELNKAKAAGESADNLEQLETTWRRDRKDMLKWVDRCGPCTTVQVRKVTIENVSRREVWYVAEGACQQLGDARSLESGFEASWKSLQKVAGYGRKTGGFEPILEFIPVDGKTGELRPNHVNLDVFPFPVVLGLKATEFLGTSVIYRQFADVQWAETKSGDRKDAVQVTVKTATPPANFQIPDMTDSWESGRPKRTTIFPVSAIHAVWYLNAQGYARYYMAGEFGANLPFANESGRASAMEALYSLYKRAH